MILDNAVHKAGDAEPTGPVTMPDPARYDHFLVTRFNVRSFYHSGEPTEAWLRERLELFLTFCLPSVAGQSSGRFTWLVFFDDQTPAWFRELVEARSGKVFEAVYVTGYFDHHTVSREVGLRATAPFIITTRLDNDDALSRDFISVIQQQFAEQDFQFINLTSGAQFADGRYYLRPYTKNPFLSLIERNEGDLRTVMVEHHYRIDQAGPVRNVRTWHPQWLQIVHGGNVLNEIVGLRVPARSVTPYFCGDLPQQDAWGDLLTGMLATSLRIALRLLRKPQRLRELVSVIRAHAVPSGR
ncbi:Putative rhamnosyl transferase [Raineyella antarctica]|uniref:Putative rhamnosyl transferase n=1 Tax=Raineyella antarctica TaxID=1577474 RepID=A0A1G6GKC7_9ACTN|nr:glycosyltransferase [Raineyella antarctica]SDB82461.1 Putative rhamnosyl transferase [Raineyella antarctica]